MAIMSALLTSLLILSFLSRGTSLSSKYYEKTCPNAESLIRKAVRDVVTKDKKVPAELLRMHFHDRFIRVSRIPHCSKTESTTSTPQWMLTRQSGLHFLKFKEHLPSQEQCKECRCSNGSFFNKF
ncbi:heme peroxidase [Artemisia annua]|uniref:peroxidase n=1 Tax=Artemisia annua TaxID=35608 RepID=A0A2U1QHM4_ARTAN|nr:heme peroxidase [Artemisia annua]